MTCFVGVLAGWVPWFTVLRWGGGSSRSCWRKQADVWNVRTTSAGEWGRLVPNHVECGNGWFSESLTQAQFKWESTSWTKATAGAYGELECARRWEPLKLERYVSKGERIVAKVPRHYAQINVLSATLILWNWSCGCLSIWDSDPSAMDKILRICPMLTTCLLGENNSRLQTGPREPFYQLRWLKVASCEQRKTKAPSLLANRLEQSSVYCLRQLENTGCALERGKWLDSLISVYKKS